MGNIKELKELKEKIESIEVNYDYDGTYAILINTVTDYMNETQDFGFESIYENIIDYELAEEQAKYELENGGPIRLYYFLGDANLNNDIFRINGYGNLEDIDIDDLNNIKEEIIDMINEKLEEVSE